MKVKSDLVDITAHLHAKTDRAVLISDDGDEKKAVWIPLSQCDVSKVTRNLIEVTMPEWLALDKGLI